MPVLRTKLIDLSNDSVHAAVIRSRRQHRYQATLLFLYGPYLTIGRLGDSKQNAWTWHYGHCLESCRHYTAQPAPTYVLWNQNKSIMIATICVRLGKTTWYHMQDHIVQIMSYIFVYVTWYHTSTVMICKAEEIPEWFQSADLVWSHYTSHFKFPSVKERGILVQGEKELQELVVQISFYAKELAATLLSRLALSWFIHSLQSGHYSGMPFSSFTRRLRHGDGGGNTATCGGSFSVSLSAKTLPNFSPSTSRSFHVDQPARPDPGRVLDDNNNDDKVAAAASRRRLEQRPRLSSGPACRRQGCLAGQVGPACGLCHHDATGHRADTLPRRFNWACG